MPTATTLPSPIVAPNIGPFSIDSKIPKGSKVLIVDCGIAYALAQGKLNHHIADTTAGWLEQSSYQIKRTRLEDGWDIKEEGEKVTWADIILYSFPAWNMGPPAKFKEWMDMVFVSAAATLVPAGDGRSRQDASKLYGSGGAMQKTKYFFISTWNAPKEAFMEPAQHFMDTGIEGIFLPYHLAHKFCGFTPLPGLMFWDVVKNPIIEEDMKRLRSHVESIFEI